MYGYSVMKVIASENVINYQMRINYDTSGSIYWYVCDRKLP